MIPPEHILATCLVLDPIGPMRPISPVCGAVHYKRIVFPVEADL